MEETGKAIQKIINPNPNKIDDELEPYFDLIHKMDDKDQIKDHRCKFCNHELREQAETIWDNTKSFKRILEFFHKNGHKEMNLRNVRNHIRAHYLRQEQLMMRRHYAERLLPTINYKINKLRRIETLVAILQDKIWNYASIDHENDTERRRDTDLLLKIMKEMTNLLKLQADLEGDLKPIEIVVEKVQQIVVNTMNKIDDPELRLMFTKEMESLKDISIINV